MEYEIGSLVRIKNYFELRYDSTIVKRNSLTKLASQLKFECGTVYEVRDLAKIAGKRFFLRGYDHKKGSYIAHPLGKPTFIYYLKPCLIEQVIIKLAKNKISKEEKAKKRSKINERVLRSIGKWKDKKK